MPISIKNTLMSYKKSNGDYVNVDAIAGNSKIVYAVCTGVVVNPDMPKKGTYNRKQININVPDGYTPNINDYIIVKFSQIETSNPPQVYVMHYNYLGDAITSDVAIKGLEFLDSYSSSITVFEAESSYLFRYGEDFSWRIIGYNYGVKLDAEGRIPSVQLPSYVDDVLEYASLAAFPATGEASKIYVALDTNLTYRWSGSTYVEISKSLALGDTAGTAFPGERGKAVEDALPKFIELSESDASANTQLLNSLLSSQDVILKTGTYPIESTIIIDGHTFDLNGSKITVPYIEGTNMFELRGYNPCIMNGEIEGSYSEDGTYSSNQSCINVKASSDALIKGMHVHHIPGRGIDDDLNDKYGQRINYSSAVSYSAGAHTVAKKEIITGYKYLRTVGGMGFNSAYVVSPVEYRFYDSEDNTISTVLEIPSYPVEIPTGAVTFDINVETGKYDLTNGFVPFAVGFTNYNSIDRIEDCEIHDCKDWGIANIFGDAYVIRTKVIQPSGKGLDIEDHQASRITFENCTIEGRMHVNAFYATLINCNVDVYSPFYGKLHSLINCFTRIAISVEKDLFFKKPVLHITGGEVGSLLSGSISSETIEKAKLNQLLFCSGTVFGKSKYMNINQNLFGSSNFTYRSQTLKSNSQLFWGLTIGKYIIRSRNSLTGLNAITSPGSSLSIFIDAETENGQISGSLGSNTDDCYGLHGLNCIIYPSGHTIYDSSFAPEGGNTGVSNLNSATGKYIRCTFDAKKSNIIANAYTEGFNFTFINCSFKNLTANRLLLERTVRNSTVTLTFNNCIFEDAPITSKEDVLTYICSNLSNVVIVIDGTSYTQE